MNSPGRGVGSGSCTGCKHSVTESRFSSVRRWTRYGTGVIADDGACGASVSVITGFGLPGGEVVHLLGDVDPGGAPGDASPATDAARTAELVMPGA